MEFKNLTETQKLPVLGLGTWDMGGRYEADSTNDKKDILAIRSAISLGYTHIDTAELYGAGHAEELIAEAIKDIDRKSIFITSKVSPANLNYDSLITACKNSLKRLNTSYLDLYLIHGPNESIPIEETMRAMDYIVEQKLTRFIGVSNFSAKQLEEAQKHTKNRIVANQIEYNLLTRENGLHTTRMESEILPYCQKNNILFIAWRPLMKGKILEADIPLLKNLEEKYKKTRVQIALNWLITKKNVVTLVKASNPEHLKENLGAIGWSMDKEDIDALDIIEGRN